MHASDSALHSFAVKSFVAVSKASPPHRSSTAGEQGSKKNGESLPLSQVKKRRALPLPTRYRRYAKHETSSHPLPQSPYEASQVRGARVKKNGESLSLSQLKKMASVSLSYEVSQVRRARKLESAEKNRKVKRIARASPCHIKKKSERLPSIRSIAGTRCTRKQDAENHRKGSTTKTARVSPYRSLEKMASVSPSHKVSQVRGARKMESAENIKEA